MTQNDPVADALSKIDNYEKSGKREVVTRDNSKVIKKVLELMNDHGYIGDYEEVEDSKGDILKVNLLGNINEAGVIKPRFAVKKEEFEKWEKRFLPAKDFGILVLTTSEGIMTHYSAKEKGIGGRLLAYCY